MQLWFGIFKMWRIQHEHLNIQNTKHEKKILNLFLAHHMLIRFLSVNFLNLNVTCNGYQFTFWTVRVLLIVFRVFLFFVLSFCIFSKILICPTFMTWIIANSQFKTFRLWNKIENCKVVFCRSSYKQLIEEHLIDIYYSKLFD